MPDIWVFVFLIAFLYASVGHGGASGYLAVMTLLAYEPMRMAANALLLNLIVAGMAFLTFRHAGYTSTRLVWPFIVTSIPAAFLGGRLLISSQTYGWLLAVVLLVAALRLGFHRVEPVPATSVGAMAAGDRRSRVALTMALPIGAGIGLLSGIVGVGGGIFLSPLMLLCRWAPPKSVAAASALFILVNSASGLLGRLCAGRLQVFSVWPLIGVVLIGGWVGAWLGARRFSNVWMCRVLALVLVIAAAKGALHG